MDNKYIFKETDKSIALCIKDEIPLISLTRESDYRLCISFNNVEIDRLPLLMHLQKQFGKEYSCHVYCESEEESLLCQSRLAELISDGVKKNSKGIIAMDWADLEKICYGTLEGKYYHYECTPTEIQNSVKAIKNQVPHDLGENIKSIICFSGNTSMIDFVEAIDMLNIEQKAVQLLFDESSETVQIDVWAFPSN